jgi:hypothetical protein
MAKISISLPSQTLDLAKSRAAAERRSLSNYLAGLAIRDAASPELVPGHLAAPMAAVLASGGRR